MWRWVLAFVVSKRTQESANLRLDRVNYVPDDYILVDPNLLSPDCQIRAKRGFGNPL